MKGSLHHHLLTAKETATYLRIPLPTVYYLVQRGRIPAVQIGGRWRIKKDSLDHGSLGLDQPDGSLPGSALNGDSGQNLLNVRETAAYLRIPLPTVYYLMQRGRLPAIRIGGRWRIKKSALDKDVLQEVEPSPPTALVIDSDPHLQELFNSFLKRIGFHRVVVGTARGALSVLGRQRFDLMFLSLQLPDMPATGVYEQARQSDPDLNVVVLTGRPSNRDVLDQLLRLSPVTVLAKPVKTEQLEQVVKTFGHGRDSMVESHLKTKPGRKKGSRAV